MMKMLTLLLATASVLAGCASAAVPVPRMDEATAWRITA